MRPGTLLGADPSAGKHPDPTPEIRGWVFSFIPCLQVIALGQEKRTSTRVVAFFFYAKYCVNRKCGRLEKSKTPFGVFLFCPTMEEMIIKFEKLAELAKIRIALEGTDKEVLDVHVSIEDTMGEITLKYWYDRDELYPDDETERTLHYTWENQEWRECNPQGIPF